MLRVWSASGEEVASIPVGELTDVRTLKQSLQDRCGVTRFRQRLLDEHGGSLDDELQLRSAAELQLVLLSFCSASDDEKMELAGAAYRGDVQLVEEVLQRPQHPDGRWHDQAQSGDHKRRRISYATRLHSHTPLHWACTKGHAEVAALLLEAGADIGKASCSFAPLLCKEYRSGNLGAARSLLKAGATISGGEASQLLAMAAEDGHRDIARLLLKMSGGSAGEALAHAAGNCHVGDVDKSGTARTPPEKPLMEADANTDTA
ncbi:ANK1 [Symbiodinium natans]|uniref:ANK1 protein n=1 Tax=Symbiodinium natans TaxID=878477 RepID=A0A812P4W0_9DINO|nr:ANK1 [Symbiodinium natans]